MTDTESVHRPQAVVGRRPLGALLVEEGFLTEEQLEDALALRDLSEGKRERLGQALVRLGLVAERDIARMLAKQLGLGFLDTERIHPDPKAAALVPPALARRHEVVPLRQEEDGTLVLACADPTDIVARDDIRLAAGVRRIEAVVVVASAVREAVRYVYGTEHASGELLEALSSDEQSEDDDDVDPGSDAPLIRLVDSLIAEAIDAGASDVHFEPAAEGLKVRFRLDGVLRTVTTVPRSTRGKLLSRLKLMSGMDIAERRLPQDGRARLDTATSAVDLRMSSMPALHGEKIVIRLLRKGADRLRLDQVGMTEDELAVFRSAIDRPQGLVLISGPTGSGKTSTLYGALGTVADDRRNIITLEDPIEYELGGINQVQINERIGRTFARCLRTVLRQDPDIVMVGEIRDDETAELALQASLTGHLVFSTLHTNDAPQAVVRLRDLGIPSYLVASSLTLVVAQRLVRKVCRECAVETTPTDREMLQLHVAPQEVEKGTFRSGTGCAACGHTGYRGRIGIFELLVVDSRIRELITSNASTAEIRRAARLSGMRSLRDDGLAKAAAGLTTFEELLRVIPMETDDEGTCPVCAHAVRPDFNWCVSCGAEVGEGNCSGCELPLEQGWRTCPGCGTPCGRQRAQEGRLPRVLVVDDDPSVCKAIAAMLTGDYEVEAAHDARSALELAHRHRPDLAIVDVGLPDMDGYALTREFRARGITQHLPVLLITGNDDRTTELQGLQAGADDYLAKPLDLDILIARLDALRRRATHA